MSWGHALGGFAQGFADTFFQQRARKKQEEHEGERKQFQVYQDALKTATDRGDTEAVTHILRSMGDFTSAGAQGGKKGKQAQANIFGSFADMMEQSTQTPGPQGEVQPIQTDVGETTPPSPPPSPILRKGFFKSNTELAEEALAIEENRQRRLLPLKTKEALIVEDARAKNRREDIKARLAGELTKIDATGQARANKRFEELKNAVGGDEDRARELLLEEVNTGIGYKKAGIGLSEARAGLASVRAKLAPEQLKLQTERLKDAQARTQLMAERNEIARTKGQSQGGLSNQDLIKIQQAQNALEQAHHQMSGMMNSPINVNEDDETRARREENVWNSFKTQTVQNAKNIKAILGDKVEVGTEKGADNFDGDWVYIKPIEIAPQGGGSTKSLKPKATYTSPQHDTSRGFPASKLQEAAAKAYPNDREAVNKFRKDLAVRKISIDESK